LSVRFAASLVNLHDSDLKLLVLDDLLVSLDMSNRMKVVEIFLSGTFDNYQKIILTHDYGFFREFARAPTFSL
jgi:wobble nucleotide-excising tRNase